MNFENMTLKFFHVFRKKLKKNEFFSLLPHMEKVKKNTKKELFFEKLQKSLSN